MEPEAHNAAELLAHGFQFQTPRPVVEEEEGMLGIGSMALQQLQVRPFQSRPPTPPALPPPDQPGPAAASGGGGGGGAPAAAPSDPALSTHSQSRSQQSRRSKGSRGGGRAATAPGAFAIPRGKAAKAAQADATLHPVLRLGWQPLCTVVCNGLMGDFLGGHGLDLYIRCTSPAYAVLPLVDVNLGGCVMTCSQFERAAGRELSKKWKESIHVVGEGSGSVATLISWMKRRASQDFGQKVVGKLVWVCWCAEYEFYQGTIVAFNKDTGKHTVQYSESHSEDLHLPVELVSFDPVKPRPSPTFPAVAAALALPAGAQRGVGAAGQQGPQQEQGRLGFNFVFTDDDPSLTNPLWHQGSGISVTSSFQDDPLAPSNPSKHARAALSSPTPPSPSRAGTVPGPARSPGGRSLSRAAAAAAGPAGAAGQAQLPPPLTKAGLAAGSKSFLGALAAVEAAAAAAVAAAAAGDAGRVAASAKSPEASLEEARPVAEQQPRLAGSKRGLSSAEEEEGDEGGINGFELSLTIPPAPASEPVGLGGATKRLHTQVVGGEGSVFSPVPHQQQAQAGAVAKVGTRKQAPAAGPALFTGKPLKLLGNSALGSAGGGAALGSAALVMLSPMLQQVQQPRAVVGTVAGASQPPSGQQQAQQQQLPHKTQSMPQLQLAPELLPAPAGLELQQAVGHTAAGPDAQPAEPQPAQQAQRSEGGPAAPLLPTASPSANPPAGQLGLLHPQHSPRAASVQVEQPHPLPVVSRPPHAGFAEQDPTTMASWLHLAALQLEPQLAQLAASQAAGPSSQPSVPAWDIDDATPRRSDGAYSDAGSGGGRDGEAAGASGPVGAGGPSGGAALAAAGPSPCARFQAQVALARKDGTLRGIYEAMLCRYRFFSQSELLPLKLCDLMLAVLAEAALPRPASAALPRLTAGPAGQPGLAAAAVSCGRPSG